MFGDFVVCRLLTEVIMVWFYFIILDGFLLGFFNLKAHVQLQDL